MLGRLFQVLSVLSLLLCAAVIVLWVRTYSAPACLGKQADGVIELVRSYRGRVSYRRVSDDPVRREGLGPGWAPVACEPEGVRPAGTGRLGAAGFGQDEGTQFIAPAG